MKEINLNDGVERNYHGISLRYAKELLDNNMTITLHESTDTYTIYDAEGNDQEILTLDELQRR